MIGRLPAGPGPAYTAIMILSIATAVLLKRRGDRSLPLSAVQRWGIALGAFCGAMIGAKLPYVLLDWEGLSSGRAWFDNGKTILFGLVGGYFGVELAKALLDVRIKTGDSFAVPVAAAVAVGRLACFVGGCCFGKPTGLPWGVVFHDGIPRHPTQLYEAAFHASAAIFLAWTERRGLFRFQRIKLYLIAYLVYRFFTEFIRPEPVVALGLTAYQWGALALLPVFAWLWRRDARAIVLDGRDGPPDIARRPDASSTSGHRPAAGPVDSGRPVPLGSAKTAARDETERGGAEHDPPQER